MMCCAATVVIVIFVARSRNGDPGGDVQPNIAERNGPVQLTDSPRCDRGSDIDFDHLLIVVDEYYRNREVEAVPEWSTRTDSLLAMNLNIPFTEE